jgi:hypothetical protein
MPPCLRGPNLWAEEREEAVSGPQKHGLGHECPLCNAHSKAARRHTAQPHVRTRRYLPWIAPFAVTLVLISLVDSPERWIFVGLLIGLGAGAGLAWLTHLTNQHISAATLASTSEELKAEADQRVAMVIRQFEWAVNDVANLRDAVNRAQDARAVAEANEHRVRRRLHLLERQFYEARTRIGDDSRALGSEKQARRNEPAVVPADEELVVPLIWRAFEQNRLTWLRFESAGIVPSQIRIMNENESVIAISARTLDTLDEGAQVTLVVRAPDNVVATLEGRHQGRYIFEALVDDDWCKVDLKAAEPPATKDWGNRQPSTDKRSRVWRPDDDRRPQSLIA